VGEKTQKDVEADVNLYGDLPKGKGICQAILYWDDDKKAFVVTVKHHDEMKEHHTLDTKSIDRLQKVIQKKLDTQNKNESCFWVASTLFQGLQKSGFASQMYTTAADAGASKFASSIYVY